MTQKLSDKIHADRLKKRAARDAKRNKPKKVAGHARVRQERVERYTNNAVAGLLARGQAVNGRELAIGDVMQMINHTIETNAGVGSVVETLEILEREGKLVISEELRNTIDAFDHDVVRFNENAEIINIALQGETNLLGVPPELLMDTGFRSDRLVTELCPKIMADASEFTAPVETYLKEHYPNQNYRQIMFNIALTRLARIAPKYATARNAEAEEVICEDEAADINHTLDNREEV